jgi:asparagine synthase (glutamine-hydrolysing)
VEDLEPGTAVRRRLDGGETVLRWAPRVFDGPLPEEDVPREELESALGESVTRQLVADVPVGIFLSSGVDSALALAFAVEAGAQPEAFTIGFGRMGDYDERHGAGELARAFHVPHRYENLSVGFGEAVESIASAFDRPFADSSAIATLALARLARDSVTVALSGTGGDDLFAGYYRHRAHRLRPLVSALPRPLRTRLRRGDGLRGAERRNIFTLARSYLSRLADAGIGDAGEQYLRLVGTSTTAAGLRALTFAEELGPARLGVAARHRLAVPDAAALRAIQRFDIDTYLPGDLLVKEDRATMAVGLEGRVPMLGSGVAAVATRMPDRQKASLLRGKLPLREVADERLRRVRMSLRKRGFAVPLRELFEGPWRNEAAEWLGGSSSSLVDGARARDLVLRGAAPASELWALAALVAWEDELARARAEAGSLRGHAGSPAAGKPT